MAIQWMVTTEMTSHRASEKVLPMYIRGASTTALLIPSTRQRSDSPQYDHSNQRISLNFSVEERERSHNHTTKSKFHGIRKVGTPAVLHQLLEVVLIDPTRKRQGLLIEKLKTYPE